MGNKNQTAAARQPEGPSVVNEYYDLSAFELLGGKVIREVPLQQALVVSKAAKSKKITRRLSNKAALLLKSYVKRTG
jgi:hypothetical protein